MKLAERHIINPNHNFYKEIDSLCFQSKNLYNCANYQMRQRFFKEGEVFSYTELYHTLKTEEAYRELPSKVSQQTIKLLEKNWKAYFQALKSYKLNPSKFLGRPRMPHYKDKADGRFTVVYTTQAISKPALKKGLIALSKTDIKFPTKQNIIKQVRIVPRLGQYVIEVIYEKAVLQLASNKTVVGIDVGLNNLAAVVSNKKGFKHFLINGNPLKAINQFYNKENAKLRSILEDSTSKRLHKLANKRKQKIDDYLHKASKYIIDRLVEHNITQLIIGKSDNWKQEINLGRRNNQNFVQVPHARFIEMLSYKAELQGITVKITEESYTSKTSFLDNEKPTKQESYKGRRIKRGLFKSSDGQLINADLNGAYQIIKKVVPNAFVEGIEAVVVPPVKVTLSN